MIRETFRLHRDRNQCLGRGSRRGDRGQSGRITTLLFACQQTSRTVHRIGVARTRVVRAMRMRETCAEYLLCTIVPTETGSPIRFCDTIAPNGTPVHRETASTIGDDTRPGHQNDKSYGNRSGHGVHTRSRAPVVSGVPFLFISNSCFAGHRQRLPHNSLQPDTGPRQIGGAPLDPATSASISNGTCSGDGARWRYHCPIRHSHWLTFAHSRADAYLS